MKQLQPMLQYVLSFHWEFSNGNANVVFKKSSFKKSATCVLYALLPPAGEKCGKKTSFKIQILLSGRVIK